jgi:hypothetical protein
VRSLRCMFSISAISAIMHHRLPSQRKALGPAFVESEPTFACDNHPATGDRFGLTSSGSTPSSNRRGQFAKSPKIARLLGWDPACRRNHRQAEPVGVVIVPRRSMRHGASVGQLVILLDTAHYLF